MEAHPCEKESFLDRSWRYVNEIVSAIDNNYYVQMTKIIS